MKAFSTMFTYLIIMPPGCSKFESLTKLEGFKEITDDLMLIIRRASD